MKWYYINYDTGYAYSMCFFAGCVVPEVVISFYEGNITGEIVQNRENECECGCCKVYNWYFDDFILFCETEDETDIPDFEECCNRMANQIQPAREYLEYFERME